VSSADHFEVPHLTGKWSSVWNFPEANFQFVEEYPNDGGVPEVEDEYGFSRVSPSLH
jgi:hypothetical protein